MEIEKLISALDETISRLRKSESSDWANLSVDDIVQELESVVATIRNSGSVDMQLLGFLFAPTAAIQETAIDNGWGDEFLRISEVIGQFTGDG